MAHNGLQHHQMQLLAYTSASNLYATQGQQIYK